MKKAVLFIFLFTNLHFISVWIVSFAAEVSGRHSGWKTAATVVGFPLSMLPQFLDGGLLALLLLVLQSLLWGALLYGLALLLVHRLGSGPAAVLLVCLALAGPALHYLRLPDPTEDWRQTWFGQHELRLSWVFEDSPEEQAINEAIQRGIEPGGPPPPTDRQRWYWGYESTLSGFPEYKAVIVAAEAASIDRPAFIQLLGRQPAQGWSRPPEVWQPLRQGAGWELTTFLPEPLPGAVANLERERLLRIAGTAPVGGVWIGAMALQRKLSPEQMVEIYRKATERLASGSAAAEVVPR